MEKMNGGSLEKLIKLKRKIFEKYKQKEAVINNEQANKIMEDILKGLCQIHIKNFIHRDLKPENILLQINESEPADSKNRFDAKIADFGLSAEHKVNVFSEQQNVDEKMGTILFMAPE